MKKGVISISISILLLIVTGLTVFANDITVKVGSEIVIFSEQNPIIKNGRTLIPIRGVFEKMGATVLWDDAEKKVTVEDENNVIVITIGSNEMQKNNEIIYLDVPAEIENGRTLLPVRAISEALGWEVFWGGLTRTVSLYETAADNPHDTILNGYIHGDYHIEEFFNTTYGSVLHMWNKVAPTKSWTINLIKPSGEVINLYDKVPRESLRKWPMCESIALSADEKTLSYTVFFSERSAGNLGGDEIVLHEAGRYYFEANLETGEHNQIAFEPLTN